MVKITKETMDLVKAVKAVYGKFPDIPEGYEVIGFGTRREYPTEELYLRTEEEGGTVANTWGLPALFPRRIFLKRLPPPPPPVLSATITSDEVYPGGYEVPEGYKVLGFGRRNDFPSATHGIVVHPDGGLSCGTEPVLWIGFHLRRIFLEKI